MLKETTTVCHDLALLCLQQKDLSNKSVEEIVALYNETLTTVKKCFKPSSEDVKGFFDM